MTSIKIEPASYFGAKGSAFFVCNVCMGALWSLVYALVSDACYCMCMGSLWSLVYALVNDICFVTCRCAMLLEVMERMTLSIEGKGNVSFLKQHTVNF